MSRRHLVFGLLLVACGSSSPAPTPSIAVRVSLPAELSAQRVASLVLTLRSVASSDAPSVTIGTFGAQIRTLTADGGIGATEIRLGLSPFASGPATILLAPVKGSATESGTAFTVDAVGLQSTGVTLAQGSASADATGQPIHFDKTNDARVEVQMTCALAEGCAADAGAQDAGPPDAGVDAGPQTINVNGHIVDLGGLPVPDAKVSVGATAVSLDDGGAFVAGGVTPPYDITATNAGVTNASTWVGLTSESPTAALPLTTVAANGGLRSAVLVVNYYSFGDETTGRVVAVAPAGNADGDDPALVGGFIGQGMFDRIVDGGGPPPIFVSWIGPPSIDVVVVAAQYPAFLVDGGPNPFFDGGTPFPAYYSMGVRKVPINDQGNLEIYIYNNLYFDDFRNLKVNTTGAAGLPQRAFYPMLDVDGVQVPLPGTPTKGYSADFVPFLGIDTSGGSVCDPGTTCRPYVAVVALEADGGAGESSLRGRSLQVASAPVADGVTTIDVALPEPTEVISPNPPPDAGVDGGVDGGTVDGGADAGVVLAAPLAYEIATPSAYQAHGLLLFDSRGGRAHTLWTTNGTGTFPDLRSFDGGFATGRPFIFLATSMTDSNYTPASLVQRAQGAVPLSGAIGTFGYPFALAPGQARSYVFRVMELNP